MSTAKTVAEKAARAFSVLGVAHFLVSLLCWAMLGWVIVRSGASAVYLAPAASAIVPLGVFSLSLLRSRSGNRDVWILLGLGLAVSSAWMAFDVHHQSYQLQMMTSDEGCRHFYATWWWYGGSS